MKTEPNESAFPEVNHDNPQFSYPTYGLTKREYFTAMAMQGLLANPEYIKKTTKTSTVSFLQGNAIDSVIAADELIKALNNQQP